MPSPDEKPTLSTPNLPRCEPHVLFPSSVSNWSSCLASGHARNVAAVICAIACPGSYRRGPRGGHQRPRADDVGHGCTSRDIGSSMEPGVLGARFTGRRDDAGEGDAGSRGGARRWRRGRRRGGLPGSHRTTTTTEGSSDDSGLEEHDDDARGDGARGRAAASARARGPGRRHRRRHRSVERPRRRWTRTKYPCRWCELSPGRRHATRIDG